MHQLERRLLELLAEPSRHSAHFDDLVAGLDADPGDLARIINHARQYGFVSGRVGGYLDPNDLRSFLGMYAITDKGRAALRRD